MTSSPTETAPHVGTVLGSRYALLRHIARGGMGDVYEGEDRLLQRRVAVKVYRAASPADRARFDEEVRVLASLNHPGLVRVFDAGPHGDDAYVVLELVDGPPLSECIAEGGPLEPRRVAELGAELADALGFIHGHGVVHRDVTPANVLCDPQGRSRLVDFGIVRLLDSPRVTSASIAIGTAGYMAPEQVQGHDVTPAADVYSLGLLLLEALTGRHEFVGTVQEVAMARLVRDPDVHTGTPEGWRPLLARMCARDPEQRPSAAEVRDHLAALADGRVPVPQTGATAAAVALAGTALDQPTAPVPATASGAVAEPTVALHATVPTAAPVPGDGTTVIPAVTFAGAPTAPRRRRRASILVVAGGIAAALVAVPTLAALAGPDDAGAPPTETTTTTAPTTTTTTEARAVREAPVRTAETTPPTAATATTAAPPPTVPAVIPDPPAAEPPVDEAPAGGEAAAAPADAPPTG
ncbi:MAG: serine/threonine-protein kinase [Acidimicrobiales bacterium]|nr:serine/threonine-protein kinase [Acidimicrobiales bacterium]